MMNDVTLTFGHRGTQDVVSVQATKAPHILVAGMTGAGKSVLVHDLICQIIAQASPYDAGFVLIDPKRVEFSMYAGVPHLVYDPVYDDRQIEYILGWAVTEMNNRFATMQHLGWRDATGRGNWPRLFVVVDELANLMLKGKRFERPLVEIASMGRAAGIHLILATQRPDATVINGLIRANVPTRVALPTLTAADSRIILDETGAEKIHVPERLVRLPGQRGLLKVEGRHWKDSDIQKTIGVWERVPDHVRT